jgi:hypothetical protein
VRSQRRDRRVDLDGRADLILRGGEDFHGFEGLLCEEGQHCQFGDDRCDFLDDMGTCRVVPDFCTMNWNPVWGCDSKTYSNRCYAATAKVSVRKTGACAAE